MKNLVLRRGEDRRIRAGHLWVFSNEVDVAKSPLKDFEAGQCVRVTDSGGRPLASAYINPASLICARIISRKADIELGPDLLRQRITSALKLRETLIDVPYYRLIFGEGDFLPGLVVDRFGDHAAAQITTAGMEAHRDDIASILGETLGLQSLLWRNDTGSRELEGLPRYVEAAFGTPPDDIELVESGARFIAPFAGGQKTGWFYDQRDNRLAAARFAAQSVASDNAKGARVPSEGARVPSEGARVLDAFCYVGSFGVMAAKNHAAAVTFLDASQVALDYATRNAALNAPDCPVDTIQGDAMETLRALRDQGRTFDMVCIDPPAFIKRRKDAKAGLTAYQKVNELALDLVEDGGTLVTCSCSQHLERAMLRRVLAHAASRRKAHAQIIYQGHQGPDHPVHPAMLETDYLKCFIARINKRS